MSSALLAASWIAVNKILIETILVSTILAFSVQVALRSGVFSMAGIGFYGIGSYAAALLVKRGWDGGLAISAAVVLSILLAYVLAILFIRLQHLYLAMATFAFDLMVGVVATNWTTLTGGASGLGGIPVSVGFWALITIAVVVAFFLTLMESGTLGRALLTIREDDELAQSFGINVRRYRRFVFVISAALGSLAGSLHALIFTIIQPTDAGFDLIVLMLTMVIIGGLGSWMGAALGAFLITWIPYRLTNLGTWWPLYYSVLMILVAMFAPGGLLSVAGRGISRLRSRRSLASAVMSDHVEAKA